MSVEKKKNKYLERREVHQEIAKRLVTTKKPIVLKIRGEQEIKGSIRFLGGGEIARCFQSENVTLNDMTSEQGNPWAIILALNRLIATSFTNDEGETYTAEDLNQLLTGKETSRVSNEIMILSQYSERESEVTTENAGPLESFRPK